MIICCGEALIDMVRSGTAGGAPKSGGECFLPLPGGSPFNTAIAIGRMGVPVKFLGKFSTDFFGDVLVKRLRDNKVGDELMLRSPQNTTLAFVKLEKGKEPRYIFYTEGTACCSMTTDDIPKKLPEDTHCIVFGSIAMTMEPVSTAIETLVLMENALQSQGKEPPIISFDPNIRPFMISDKKAYIKRFEKWVAASTIVKISAADFEFIYPGLELNKALQKILTMGPRMVISTLGAKGAVAMVRRNDGTILRGSAPVVNLPVVDTIGAGDAFHGAFLSWLEIKEKMSRPSLASLTETELYDALFFANKAASLVCARQGAEPPTRREVEALKDAGAKSGAKSGAAKSPAVKTPAVKKADTKAKPADKSAAQKVPSKQAAAKETAAEKKTAAAGKAKPEAAVKKTALKNDKKSLAPVKAADKTKNPASKKSTK